MIHGTGPSPDELELQALDLSPVSSLSIHSSEEHSDGLTQEVSISSVTPLFPRINYNGGISTDGSHQHIQTNIDDIPRRLQLQQQPRPSMKKDEVIPSSLSVFEVIDDAASSICIDDDEDGTSMRHTAMDVLRSQPPTSDFDEYTHRVAREVVLREKAERRMRRVKDSRQYGNYFSSETDNNTYTPSYQYDNFNGRRQNENYNHQLNQLNSVYTHEEQRRRRRNRPQPEILVEEMPDEVSFITMDIDELESDDYSIRSYDHNGVPKLKRKLLSRHIQFAALVGTFGVGTFFNSGQTYFFTGPLGTLLGYLITGSMVLCAMMCLGEMMALLPTDAGITSFASRFVDDSLGFALGICYWFSCAMALPSEVTAASIMIANYPLLSMVSIGDRSIVVWITFFLIIVLLVNLFDVGILGELQFIINFVVVLCLVMLLILFCALNNGAVGPFHDKVGFRYWDFSKSNFTTHQVYGPFRPSFALTFDEQPNHVEITNSIGGALGRFVQACVAVTDSAFSYIGTELVFTTAAEVRNPRKAIPAATRCIFWRVLIFYCLVTFIVGINIYAGDPQLMTLSSNALELRARANPEDITATPPGVVGLCSTSYQTWTSFNGMASSPWILALQYTGLCSLAASLNALLIVCALSSAVSHLYAASRTLYGLAIQGKIWHKFTRCSNAGVPYISVLFSFLFSLLAYMTSNTTSNKVFNWLVVLCTSAGLLVWAGCCLAFIRFYSGLKLRTDIINRDDVTYPYKSPFQPYMAYFGLCSNTVVVIFLGFDLFLEDQWDTSLFFATYSSLLVFLVCYCVHKLITKSPLVSLDRADYDSGRKDVENIAWDEDRVYNHGVVEWTLNHYGRMKMWLKYLMKRGQGPDELTSNW
jgi:amino acid transporter